LPRGRDEHNGQKGQEKKSQLAKVQLFGQPNQRGAPGSKPGSMRNVREGVHFEVLRKERMREGEEWKSERKKIGNGKLLAGRMRTKKFTPTTETGGLAGQSGAKGRLSKKHRWGGKGGKY